MEMASSEVEISSCQTFNCVLSPHDRCNRDNNNNKKNKNKKNKNVRNIQVEKNLNVFVRDNLENCSVSVVHCDDESTKSVPECSSYKSSVSDHRLSKTEESRHEVPSSLGGDPDPSISESGQPMNPSKKEPMAASSLVQIWEARTMQQPQSSNQNQSQIDSRTSSSVSNFLENSESLNEEAVKESDLIQSIEESDLIQPIEECDSQFVQTPDSGEKEREGVRVMDIIRKLSNDSETVTNNDNVSNISSNDNSKEVQTTEARCFPQVACSPRIRGRQAFADLLEQMTRDREKDLASLLKRHSVSKFTHRGRIQSTLRIRCLERCIAIQDSYRCKSSPAGSDLNRSPRGSGVMHVPREKYKTNSEKIETGASVSCRGPHKAIEKKVLQETIEKSDLKEAQEVKKAVLSEIAENKGGLTKSAGETIQKESVEERGGKQPSKEKSVTKESLEGRGEKRELTKEKAIVKENVERNGLVGIAEKMNLWNSEEKTDKRRELEKDKIESKVNTERSEKNVELEEATRRIINVENAKRSITTKMETKKKEDCVSVESKSKEIDKRNSNLQEVTAQADALLPKPASDEKVLQEKSDIKKPIEKESREERREKEESVEGNTSMGIAEKVNLWNSKDKKNRRRVMEKGKARKTEDKDKTETNEVLKEASKRIINVATAERSIASSKETVAKVVGTQEMMDKREISRETSRCESSEKGKSKKDEDFASVEAKSKETIEDKNMNPQKVTQEEKPLCSGSRERNKEKKSLQHSEEMSILQNSESKSTQEIDKNNYEEVNQDAGSVSEAKVKKFPQQDHEEMLIMRNPNDQKGIKESEDEETKKVKCEEKEENVKEVAVNFVNDWDENEMEEEEEEEEEYGDYYDHYNGDNTDDWINEISRPRSYWEGLRKERYLEVLNTESDKKDICNLIERRTVSNFLTSELRQKIDNLMISRVQGHVGVKTNQEEEEEEDEEEEEEWEVECSARNQEDDETEEEPEKTNLEATSDICSQSSARSSTLISWSFRDRDIDKDHEPTTSLSLPEPLVPTNESTKEMQMISDLMGQMKQLQGEILELKSCVKSCVDMQLHLQKSVTQDHSRSEQRVETKKDPLKRKCCVCSEMPVDSLLYRCGHMCTCLKCAHELQWSSKKCPICMAPIVDVVRAFLDS